MKILGIGVDIIENKRIKNSIKNIKFINRIYSTKEIKRSKLYNNKVNYFSKRCAAKEAFVKALGTGFRININFKDIEIINDNILDKKDLLPDAKDNSKLDESGVEIFKEDPLPYVQASTAAFSRSAVPSPLVSTFVLA